MPITMHLTDDATKVIRAKFPEGRGAGAYVSSLIVADEARKETRQALAQQHTRASRPPKQS